MGAPNVAEIAALSLAVWASALGCSDHHVSPWGVAEHPTLAPYFEQPDLAGHLATIDRETAQLGLSLVTEITARIPAEGPLVIRSYAGVDVAHRRVHAVRAASARGVVMAVGPLDPSDLDRTAATELVPALLAGDGDEGGAWRSGTDLNGDGRPDVVLRSETGALEIWGVGAAGAGRYAITMEAPPTHAVDVDGDGRPELAGERAVAAGDPIQPVFDDVAFFEGTAYSDATEAAKALHLRRAAALEREERAKATTADAHEGDAHAHGDRARASEPHPSSADAGAPPPPPPPLAPELRLRRALELAWHAILGGRDRDKVLQALDLEPVPAHLRASFDRDRAVVARLTSRAARITDDRRAKP